MPDFPNREAGVALLEAITNESRVLGAVPPLAHSDQLQDVAQARADDLTARHYFSHDRPEGGDFITMLQQAGVRYRWAGENLAVLTSTAQEEIRAAHQRWLTSPLHAANILDSRFTHMGVGLSAYDDGTAVACAVFVQQ